VLMAAESGRGILHPAVLKPQITHIRPRRPPTMRREITPMTMFWKSVKLLDQKRVYHRMKMHQPMNARIDIAIGMIGFGCFSLIGTDSVIQGSDR